LCGKLQRRVLPQNRLFETLQRRTRVDPEFFDELLPRFPVDVERFGLTSGAVQRQHQLAARPFAERVLAAEQVELANQSGMTAECELGLDPVLERREPLLFQPFRIRPRKWFVG